MGSLAPFLPPHLVASLASGPLPRLPHVERVPAALLFSDIDGFSALTERLQARGPEGAEEITDLVRDAFRPAIAAIRRHGGSIVSFGGDALFVLFQGPSPVARAHAAALAVKRSFERRGAIATSAGPVRLGISQVIHHGTVSLMHLGTDARRLHLVCGPPVYALARQESRMTPGGIALSRAAARLAGGPLRRVPPLPDRAPAAHLARYVAPHIGLLPAGFEGEFRTAALVFLESRGGGAPHLQHFVEGLWRALDEHGAILVGTDLSTSGTKWLCALGAPVAQENAADRAVRFALAVRALARPGLAVRASVHAGRLAAIWMGTRHRRSYELMGDVTNTAARVLARAHWGEVLTTHETRAQLSGVRTASRGIHAVKGKARPLELHAVLAASAPVRALRRMAPLVGRDRELARIRRALLRARRGEGGALAILGPAGLGKSRLKWEAARIAAHAGFDVAEGRAPAFGGRPYGPIVELALRTIGLIPGSAGATLREALGDLGLARADVGRLERLLGAGRDEPGLARLGPKDARRADMGSLACLFAARAAARPQLWVLEDMHWADEVTREAVLHLAAVAARSRALLLLLTRPGYDPPRACPQMALEELDGSAVETMLSSLLRGTRSGVLRPLVDRAAGNPFYVEEVVRHLKDSGVLRAAPGGYELVRDPGPADLPPTLESVIAARLDRLPPGVQRVALIGAVIGREFSEEIVARLDRGSAAALRELQARELLFEKAPEPRRTYIWKHALTRDAIYGRTLARRRRPLHRAVADALEELEAGRRPELLATIGHHREQAGQDDEACACYLEAAADASRHSAHEEAERLYRKVIALPDRPLERELAARLELARRVLRLRGRTRESESESRLALEQARRLARADVEAEALCELATVHHVTGRFDDARRLFEESIAIDRRLGHDAREGIATGRLGDACREQGLHDRAEELYRRALELHRRTGNRDAEGAVLANLGNLEIGRGRQEAARDYYEQGLAVARDAGDRFTEGIAVANLASLALSEGRHEEARAGLERAAGIGEEIGYRRFEAFVIGSLGALAHADGRLADARRLYEQGRDLADAAEDRQLGAVMRINLASTLETLGLDAQAQRLSREAIATFHDIGDRRHEGMALTNLAVGQLERARTTLTERRLGEALVLLRAVGERRQEGRALEALANLRRRAGRVAEARGLLEETIAIAREVHDPGSECLALCSLAELHAIAGDLPRAQALGREAEALRDRLGRQDAHRLDLFAGHAALAAGRSAAAIIARVRASLRELGLRPRSEAGRWVRRLERAERAFRAGKALVGGFLPTDVAREQPGGR